MNMNKHFHILLLLLLSVALGACRKEITLDLDNESNKVVIEATITEGSGPHTVQLTRSIRFEDPNTFPAISNATVTLSDDQGNSEQLSETAQGIYNTATLMGEPGRIYHLTATVEGNTYTASCSMPVAVELQAVLADSIASFGTYMKIVVPVYADPAGSANYYRYIVHVNDEKLDGVYLENDRFTNGNVVFQPLFLNDHELKSGDMVQVTMECIAPEVFQYFFSMGQNVSNAATPADPVSNIVGGALGYFSAHATSTRSVVVL